MTANNTGFAHMPNIAGKQDGSQGMPYAFGLCTMYQG